MLAEYFIGAPLAYLIHYCRSYNMGIGLAIGCYTPLSFVEEFIYDIDRLHIVTHGVDNTDGNENWSWRPSILDWVKKARRLIDEKNPQCELALDDGMRFDDMAPLIQAEPDMLILSSAIFKHPEGIVEGVNACQNLIKKVQQDN